ncbi:Arm DNA-binding domain-containing protein [Lacticaseibacillus paracasei]|uniref:Arm DNA-binding domain-containing protein n=2 Tax=Lacticaseibacillus paracasei TaxID=1597 RepID=UPI0002E04C77|nr:Arm DNA-binding domain-containing protein [Lacticaseibacillus paracasei]MDN5966079.1 Arm DNA-binding domain-containing protein [Lactococcus sp.]MCL4175904.1 Arm DNA-binding domain-containing protein [Lacticaseibacillus paracasei]MCO7165502.1 Arm DNA-binding domain-containing protein [Lacticaseibacillus paracasei]MCZ2751548.1 Arm DNA-binding domain-containing protein [Lacticaseibacillus paracasei]MCZ2762119.1 Arm DNA-binding domain-containing protein [Lacticaseibacillus paracasei]
MASIRSYKLDSGKRRWKVSVYVGIDPKTGHKKYVVKGGKLTRQDAIKAGLIWRKLFRMVNSRLHLKLIKLHESLKMSMKNG